MTHDITMWLYLPAHVHMAVKQVQKLKLKLAQRS